jgi:hypothetical protein
MVEKHMPMLKAEIIVFFFLVVLMLFSNTSEKVYLVAHYFSLRCLHTIRTGRDFLSKTSPRMTTVLATKPNDTTSIDGVCRKSCLISRKTTTRNQSLRG